MIKTPSSESRIERVIIMEKEEYTCVVCGHPLSAHIDEGEYWRCHCLGPDLYQCECHLPKERAGEEGILYYALELRIKKKIEEIKEGRA
mgnify:CR=1 FL=1